MNPYFKYILKYAYVLIPLPNLNPNLIYFELYFKVCARTYTPTAGATGLPYKYMHILIKRLVKRPKHIHILYHVLNP